MPYPEPSEAEIREYKILVDSLVEIAKNRAIINSFEKGNPRNEFIKNSPVSLLPEHTKKDIAHLMRDSSESAIHGALAFLMQKNYVQTKDGVTIPHFVFGEIFYDFIGRSMGHPWPDEDDEIPRPSS